MFLSHLPKSTPDLNAMPCRRNSRNQAHLQRNSKQFKAGEFKIQNPFRGTEQENIIPSNILSQIQQLQYISSKSIKNIEVPQCKRVSGIMRNLQMMQQLAKRQQEKYTGMIKQGTKALDRKHVHFNNDSTKINMIDDDCVSLQINGFYDYAQRIEDDFSIFDKQNSDMLEQNVAMFYSNGQLQSNRMEQQLNNYLD